MAVSAITALLVEPAADRQELMDQLMALVYDELRRMARRQLSLETGPRTVKRDWMLARAWLHRDLEHA